MPVIQCPSCKRSLNLKQMPSAARIKCPACSNAIPIAGAAAGGAAGAAAAAGGRPRGTPLTPEDEGFDFGQIQFPSAGPAAVTTFQTGDKPISVYQGPIPGDPLADESGQPTPESEAASQTSAKKAKAKGTLSPTTMAAILGGVVFLLIVAVVVGTIVAGGSADQTDTATATAAP